MEMDEAKELARRMIAGVGARILEERTRDTPFGWVFFYETTDSVGRLVGNAPILVDRSTGGAYFTGTAFSVEEYVEAYERVGGEARRMTEYIKAKRRG